MVKDNAHLPLVPAAQTTSTVTPDPIAPHDLVDASVSDRSNELGVAPASLRRPKTASASFLRTILFSVSLPSADVLLVAFLCRLMCLHSSDLNADTGRRVTKATTTTRQCPVAMQSPTAGSPVPQIRRDVQVADLSGSREGERQRDLIQASKSAESPHAHHTLRCSSRRSDVIGHATSCPRSTSADGGGVGIHLDWV
jgi:hypothetical protein